jgi:hypothetical protein
MNQGNTPLLHTIEQTRKLLACGHNSVYNLVKRNAFTTLGIRAQRTADAGR